MFSLYRRNLFGSLCRFCSILLLAGSGCANRESVGTLQTQTPPDFSASGQVAAPNRWWTAWGDPKLDYQVNQALNGNFVLAAAVQRLRAARALTRREASDLWPDLDGVVDMDSTYGPGASAGVTAWGFDTSYQVDLWGEIASRVDAERLRTAATNAEYHAIALTLSAEISRTWFAMIESHAQLRLLDEQIQTNETGLALQESRFGLGMIRSADVLRQRQLVESTLEQKVVVQAQTELLEHQLAVLLGQMPQTAQFRPGDVLPDLPPMPETGLPSELLQRRPDVRRDYLAFQAADRDLASAISSQYPRINLGASVLNVAEHPETLFRDWFVSIGGQLIAPIFDGGQRRAEVDRTSAVVSERFNQYGETMLQAFREVEDSLAQEKYQRQRIEHLNNQVVLARQSSEQLREQYLIGDAEYLDVLSAIQAQQRLQRETLSARLELILIRINLYLALAGDFDTRPQEFPEIQGIVEVSEGLESLNVSDVSEFLDGAEGPDGVSTVEISPEIVIDE
ncbi:Toluene efflux pump outer membrane protein TtgI precursor [Roseimaritima multifibrata]|uniref:Toluene efflux pump outer membrane protein TtgI n=1 Tax=Roseimaritima multifibrata TaxID=1930274 RepID=A0A517MGJ0_9BACT|nr:TolC family protein [Roseimaritima multifibrata]QDS94001.1 Toluene efflux pump outer membrane protein TtgI precursor [Roseimaritima multifibrata]